MKAINSYSKVYNLGHPAVEELFNDEVIIEEKIDGSQFSFMKKDETLYFRSKNKEMYIDADEGMFNLAIKNINNIKKLLENEWIYRCEYLQKPKHNTLFYDRVPENNIIVYDIDTENQKYLNYEKKRMHVEKIGLECVPILMKGKIENIDQFKELLDIKSVLGAITIEGVVIKNYSRFTRDAKTMMAKYVSDKFKEVHDSDWKKRNPTKKDVIYEIGLKYKTKQRWEKAIQHTRDKNELTNSPKDIGMLLKEIVKDVKEECEDDIKQILFNHAWKNISRIVIGGFPEWYKEFLLEKQFKENE